MNNLERVQKLISNYGPYSRRQADKFVEEGKVKINGKVISPGEKATVNDKIEIDGKIIKLNLKHEYFLVNKPKGFICQREDKFGKETISLINNYKERNLFTVGRLDVNTTGLIIITTDGELSNKITSPKNDIKKTYLVWVDKHITKNISLGLQRGTTLDDGYITKIVKNFKIISNEDGKVLVKMTLIEGKKNQIRRMFESHNRKVINLKRTQIGFHKIDGIETGKSKKLSKSEMYKGLKMNFS
ncbi:MAG: rRNA pseudouridine synthase [Mycoplasmataceae bacterium]|nr:rRNA pseudouridine synthase [Mycoplasmataceae bacterium]